MIQDVNVAAARKFNVDLNLIEEKVDVQKNIEVLGNDLTFLAVREFERTKHVHRIHPYLGKFIPQLVEVFLKKFFKRGDTVLDPFSGSGTTLIEANTLGINSIGIELSAFNVLIQNVKTRKYNLGFVEKEIKSALSRLEIFSKTLISGSPPLLEKRNEKFKCTSSYLKEWFSARAIQEMLFFRSIIKEYNNQDILTVILSRAARSARQITHYDLARPKKPVRETYWCIKHKRYCSPIDEAYKFIRRYSLDTIKRLKEFDKMRTGARIDLYQGDSRTFRIPSRKKVDGVFTSPPYVGLIDYHEQHKYAYELFEYLRLDELEIGAAVNGASKQAKSLYVEGIVEVFNNIKDCLARNARILVVANDKNGLYEEIGKRCGFELLDVFHRPVLMRTERDSNKYFESIFHFKKV